ncbi:hypothetical protein K466DRAFT_605422 [Polyporus arcularius HHB13444]|uniref:Uncharacterized protein n=1 Tax=Polyporus arcularius HHB13444 TaxID=1314778 RepID=A0A5C3NUW4_9APHY|nr:hypothetical protein K466DRAFT_605422 [Polyporus arcularius HHB13444]
MFSAPAHPRPVFKCRIVLSTAEAFYRDEAGTSPTPQLKQWKQVRVVVGEMDDGTYALIVCPVLDCGLIALPPLPLIELFLPELDALIDGQEFQSSLDYWSFMDVVSEVKVKEASRLEDYRSQLSHIYDTIPCHSSTRAVGGLCSNAAHFVADTPSSGSTTTRVKEEVDQIMRCGD